MTTTLFRYDKDGKRVPAVRRGLIVDLAWWTVAAVAIMVIAGVVVGRIWDVSVWYAVAQISAVIGFAMMLGVWWWIKGRDYDALVVLAAEKKARNSGIDYWASGEGW